jgi:hypothetical protein
LFNDLFTSHLDDIANIICVRLVRNLGQRLHQTCISIHLKPVEKFIGHEKLLVVKDRAVVPVGELVETDDVLDVLEEPSKADIKLMA